jgi:hypothetical protein
MEAKKRNESGQEVEQLIQLRRRLADMDTVANRQRMWIDDLNSGMYINCVYCGHRYGPRDAMAATIPDGTATMADALRRHIAECAAHPMSGLLAAAKYAEAVLDNMIDRDELAGIRLAELEECSNELALAIARAEGQ